MNRRLNRLDNRRTSLAAIAGNIFIAALCAAGAIGVAGSPASAPGIQVAVDRLDTPNVIGMSLADATVALTNWDPNIQIGIFGWDSTVQDFIAPPALELPSDLDPSLLTVAGEHSTTGNNCVPKACFYGTEVALGLTAIVPNLVDRAINKAGPIASAAGFELLAGDLPAADIINFQKPNAGDVVDVRAFPVGQIAILVGAPSSPPTSLAPSSPPAVVAVPDLSGLSGGQATDLLQKNGLRAELQGGGQADKVVRQTPIAGATVTPGTTVTVYLSTPNVGGPQNASDQSPGQGSPTLPYLIAALAILAIATALLLRRHGHHRSRKPLQVRVETRPLPPTVHVRETED